ncbi:hypothetical protein HYR53_10765 [Candidatus Acetothermia bacterium]|nr:hypothetical protein [Candidatus Acetothermia bacterium]
MKLFIFVLLLSASILFTASEISAQSVSPIASLLSGMQGNFSAGFLWLSLDSLSDALNAKGYPRLPNQMEMNGAGQSNQVDESWRIGSSIMYGAVAALSGESVSRLNVMNGVVLFQYGYLINPYLRASFGLGVGGSLVTLHLLQKKSGSFEDALTTPTSTELSRGFTILQPQVSLSLAPMPRFSIQIAAGLQIALFDNGWMQEISKVGGPPNDFNGFFITATLELGQLLSAQTNEAK